MHYIKETKEFGRGLYALHTIHRRSIVFRCELLVLGSIDTSTVNESGLKHYTFKYNNAQDCIVLGDGSMFNHSKEPNVAYRLEPIVEGGRPVMVFWALKDIQPHEQLFIDYKQDDEYANLEQYVKAASLYDFSSSIEDR